MSECRFYLANEGPESFSVTSKGVKFYLSCSEDLCLGSLSLRCVTVQAKREGFRQQTSKGLFVPKFYVES